MSTSAQAPMTSDAKSFVQLAGRFAIRELIENWVLWRDAGDWERFARLWRPDGRMNTSWCSAPASEFIERSRQASVAGLAVVHSLGGSSIEVQGDRAVAETRMQILQRGEVAGALCDVICYGRFLDALERDGGGDWGLTYRQPIYELDHLVPLDPTQPPAIDAKRLAVYPEGYRHLAYLQTDLGFVVSPDLPGRTGPAVERLRARAQDWLGGAGAIS